MNAKPKLQVLDMLDGQVLHTYILNGIPHNGPNGEAAIERWLHGQLVRQEYRSNGQRSNGPNGEPGYQEWFDGGQLKCCNFLTSQHLSNGPNGEPAATRYYEDGSLRLQEFRINGKLNPGPNGEPAKLKRRKGSGVLIAVHYLDGEKVSKITAAWYREHPLAVQAVRDAGVSFDKVHNALHLCDGDVESAITLCKLTL